MKKDDHSGEIRLADGSIVYESARMNWRVPLSDVRLIGEYTTANGPYVDDYFFVFLTAEEGGWHEASFYARGRDPLLALLEHHLGAPIQPGLCNSAEYRTRIVWPPHVKDQPLMTIIPKKTWYGRLWARIRGVQDITLSAPARSVFHVSN
jgi:hypothetical protein